MDFNLNSEQQMLQDSVRRYVDKAYAFETRADRAGQCASLDHWQAFADNGWLAAALPEAQGGLGGDLRDIAIIAQELGRGLVMEPFLGCAVAAAQTLVAGGSAAQKSRLLPGLADGSVRVALAYGEDGARGFPLPVNTCARVDAEGFRLSGHKTLVLSGGIAQHYIVSARMAGGPAGSLTLFLVDADAAGLTRTALPLHDGSLAEDLVLDGVKVPAFAVIGTIGQGLAPLQAGLADAVVAQGAELVGAMEKVIEVTAHYLKTRQQFGVPIGSFQALQHRLVDMAGELELARSMLFAALAASEGPQGADRLRTVSGAKALIGRAARFVCGQGIQLHGGIGMTEEYLVGHYFKRAVVADHQFGGIDRHEAACAFDWPVQALAGAAT